MAAGAVAFSVSVLVALLATAVYQTNLHILVKLGLGIGHTLEPLSAFPYQCRRIEDTRLQACEDMWLSESTRQLFLACSDSLTRQQWIPGGDNLNASGRSLRDTVMVMDLDEPADDGFQLRALETPGFPGANGDGLLQLTGMSGIDDEDGEIRLWLVNAMPSFDLTTGELLDQTLSGANMTIELFQTTAKATTLKHVKTFADPQIATPNRIAAIGGPTNAFYVANDKGLVKTGWKHAIAPLIRHGGVSFCDDASCKEVVQGLQYPNGLTIGQDGLVYVPSSMLGVIDVFEILPDGDLKKVDSIDVGYSLDNLSVDKDGEIFAAAFPVGKQLLDAVSDPLNSFPAAAAFRVKKNATSYEVEKVIEDGQSEVLPGATTVVHDAATGRLFFSSVISPFIAVCDKV